MVEIEEDSEFLECLALKGCSSSKVTFKISIKGEGRGRGI
jgi:hypothetical protein